MEARNPSDSTHTPVTYVHSPWLIADYSRPLSLPFPHKTANHSDINSFRFYDYVQNHLADGKNTYVQVAERKWVHGDQVTYHYLYVAATATLRDSQWTVEVGDRFELITPCPSPTISIAQTCEFLRQSWGCTGEADTTPLCPRNVFSGDISIPFPSLRRSLHVWYRNH